MCRCHQGTSAGYCHPLGLSPKGDEQISIPDGFPLENNEFTCNTCHDVYRQCQKRLFDHWMLRESPYPRLTDFCYRCHKKEDYKELDTHDQVSANGDLQVEICLYCHEKRPDEKTGTYDDVTFVGDMKALCRRCHQIEGNHAGDYDHMAQKPTAEGLRRMATMARTYSIVLPLTATGKMTCITCHNPHEKGVIPVSNPAARGAGSQYRHRLPGKMCEGCHQI